MVTPADPHVGFEQDRDRDGLCDKAVITGGLLGAGGADRSRRTITPRPLTATVVADDKPYDTTNAADGALPARSAGVIDGASIICSATAGTFADTHVGTLDRHADQFQRVGRDVGLHGAGDADDQREDTAIPLTATVVADDKPYHTTNAATVHTCEVGGVIDGASISCSATAGTFADTHVGTWPVTPTNFNVTGLTSDYTAPATPTTSAKITAIPLTATIAATTSLAIHSRMQRRCIPARSAG